MLIKISNFSKFVEYIRPVQQNSRHLVGIIDKINFNTLCPPIFLPYAIIYHFLNFYRFIFIKNFIYGKKIDRQGLNWSRDMHGP